MYECVRRIIDTKEKEERQLASWLRRLPDIEVMRKRFTMHWTRRESGEVTRLHLAAKDS